MVNGIHPDSRSGVFMVNDWFKVAAYALHCPRKWYHQELFEKPGSLLGDPYYRFVFLCIDGHGVKMVAHECTTTARRNKWEGVLKTMLSHSSFDSPGSVLGDPCYGFMCLIKIMCIVVMASVCLCLSTYCTMDARKEKVISKPCWVTRSILIIQDLSWVTHVTDSCA